MGSWGEFVTRKQRFQAALSAVNFTENFRFRPLSPVWCLHYTLHLIAFSIYPCMDRKLWCSLYGSFHWCLRFWLILSFWKAEEFKHVPDLWTEITWKKWFFHHGESDLKYLSEVPLFVFFLKVVEKRDECKANVFLPPSQISSICRAAVHAGVVRNEGGYVDVMPVDKRKVYVASFQNGIYSERYRAHLQRFTVLHFVCLYLGWWWKPNNQATRADLQSLCNSSCGDFGEAVAVELPASSKLIKHYPEKLLMK